MRIFLDNKGVSTLWSQFKAKLAVHANNSDIHVTAEEKEAWDGKAELTDIPTSLPANGGNADTVDGKHASDFVQKSGDSMSGNLRMENNQLWFGVGGSNQFRFEDTDGLLKLKNHDGTTIFTADYGGSYATNADTLDGKHAESFMQWLGCPGDTNFMNDTNYKVDYHCNIGDGTLIGLPLAGWYHIVYYMQINPGGYGMQIAYPLNFDGATFIRRSDGTTWKDWKNISDGGNASTANTANTAGTLATTPTNVCLRNISFGTANPQVTNPNAEGYVAEGALYGQYEEVTT